MGAQGRLERLANSAEDEATLAGCVEEINAVLTDYQVCTLSPCPSIDGLPVVRCFYRRRLLVLLLRPGKKVSCLIYTVKARC